METSPLYAVIGFFALFIASLRPLAQIERWYREVRSDYLTSFGGVNTPVLVPEYLLAAAGVFAASLISLALLLAALWWLILEYPL